jgi:hypothetical protein
MFNRIALAIWLIFLLAGSHEESAGQVQAARLAVQTDSYYCHLHPGAPLTQYFIEYVRHESSHGSSHGSANTSSRVPVLHNYHCTNTYSIEMLSFDPVIMSLNGFITDVEIDYLLGK